MALAFPAFKTCPCGAGRSYGHCCGPLHAGQRAATPEALMRARYCAYALGNAPYVLRTWHPQTRPAALDLRDGTRYVGLRVHRSGGTQVQFTAQLRLSGGERYELRECSEFACVDGEWLYLSGHSPSDQPPGDQSPSEQSPSDQSPGGDSPEPAPAAGTR